MPNGFIIRQALEQWLTKEKVKRGYKFVWTPHIAKSDLYKQSKHWQKYDAMMASMKIDNDEYVVKPMNCPHHFQIYNERPQVIENYLYGLQKTQLSIVMKKLEN